MKEFEKLWESNHPVYDMGSDSIGHYSIAEEYWKAALECVRDKMLPNCHEPMDIYDFIEEELNI